MRAMGTKSWRRAMRTTTPVTGGCGAKPSWAMRSSTRPRRSPSRSTSAPLTTLDRCRISMAILGAPRAARVREAAPQPSGSGVATDASVRARSPVVPGTRCLPGRAGVGPGAVCARGAILGRLVGHDLPRWPRACLKALAALGGDPCLVGAQHPHRRAPGPPRRAPPQPGGLRIAYLVYRGNPRCGGQGVYTRHLARELVALGHSVEVFAGQPWPVLDDGVGFTPVPGPRPVPRPRPLPGTASARVPLVGRSFSSSGSCARPDSPSPAPSRCGRGDCWRRDAASSTSSTTTNAWDRVCSG